MRTSARTAGTASAKRPKAKRAGKHATKPASKRAAKPVGKRAAKPVGKRAAKPASKRAAKPVGKGAAKPGKRAAKPVGKGAAKPRRKAPANRWLAFVEQHGVVLASARGPVPSVAAAVAGAPIIGSWWAHPKGKAIFVALSELDDAADVRCFKLVDRKVTFVHRRLWPALARLADGGVLEPDRVASIQQEHLPSGEHRNLITPFPAWVSDDDARAATALTIDDARALLGTWL